MRNRIFIASFAFSAFFLLASCYHDSPTPAHEKVATTTVAGASLTQQHWVQNQRLKLMMDQISKLNASIPKGLPEDVESPEGREASLAAANASTAADDLARTALLLPSLMEGKSLNEADRRGFTAEAQTLHDQAVQLRDFAQKFQVEKMQRTLSDISTTCFSCHSRYRDLAGELNSRRALLPLNHSDRLALVAD